MLIVLLDRDLFTNGQRFTCLIKMSSQSPSPIVLRRAVEEDYEAALDIRKSDIYGGTDYMKALYFIYFHIHRHVIYVLEQDGQLVSLVNYEFSPDGSHVTTMSSRVRQSHEGRGLSPDKYPQFKAKLLEEFPGVVHEMQVFTLFPEISGNLKKLEESTGLYRFTFHNYRFTPRTIEKQLAIRSPGCITPVQPLSYSTAVDLLISTNIFLTFFRQFTADYIPVDLNWRIVNIHETTQMKKLFASNYVFITYKDGSQLKNDIDGAHDDVNKNSGRPDDVTTPIAALSYSQIILGGCGCISECVVVTYYYGDTHALSDHVTAVLSYAFNIWNADDSLRFTFLYSPQFVCMSDADRCLNDCGVSGELKISAYTHRDAVIAIRPILKIKSDF